MFGKRPARPTDGAKAKVQAKANFARTQAKWPEVHRVASSLRTLREENRFAERIDHLIRGDR